MQQMQQYTTQLDALLEAKMAENQSLKKLVEEGGEHLHTCEQAIQEMLHGPKKPLNYI